MPIDPSEPPVTHLSTPEEVMRFAIEGNHAFLHACINRYRYDEHVTWEQAMQFAAIEQARALAAMQRQLIDCISVRPAPLIVEKGQLKFAGRYH